MSENKQKIVELPISRSNTSTKYNFSEIAKMSKQVLELFQEEK